MHFIVFHEKKKMSASESRQVFEELACRIGLEGEEFTALVDGRVAAQLEEEKHWQEQLEFERELEELKQRGFKRATTLVTIAEAHKRTAVLCGQAFGSSDGISTATTNRALPNIAG